MAHRRLRIGCRRTVGRDHGRTRAFALAGAAYFGGTKKAGGRQRPRRRRDYALEAAEAALPDGALLNAAMLGLYATTHRRRDAQSDDRQPKQPKPASEENHDEGHR
jgi:hypothetical protein